MKVNIGLPGDDIMQRYLLRRIFREAEFEIKETDGDRTIGFITGFDDRCIQISTTPVHDADEPLSVLIYWPVAKIRETGRRLDSLDHEHRSKIRSYSHALRAQCQQFMSGQAPGQQRPPLPAPPVKVIPVPENGQPAFSEP